MSWASGTRAFACGELQEGVRFDDWVALVPQVALVNLVDGKTSIEVDTGDVAAIYVGKTTSVDVEHCDEDIEEISEALRGCWVENDR